MSFNLTCGKGVTELQNLTNLRLSSFAESHQMQQKNFDISPKVASMTLSLALTQLIVSPTTASSIVGPGHGQAADRLSLFDISSLLPGLSDETWDDTPCFC